MDSTEKQVRNRPSSGQPNGVVLTFCLLGGFSLAIPFLGYGFSGGTGPILWLGGLGVGWFVWALRSCCHPSEGTLRLIITREELVDVPNRIRVRFGEVVAARLGRHADGKLGQSTAILLRLRGRDPGQQEQELALDVSGLELDSQQIYQIVAARIRRPESVDRLRERAVRARQCGRPDGLGWHPSRS